MIDWIKKIIGAEKQPTRATYMDKEVVVYSITKDYAIIAYQENGTGMFSVAPSELTNLK